MPLVTRRWSALAAASVCACLLIGFWVASQTAVRGKSSTYDEPVDCLGGWVHLRRGDWRINYEDPPLWQYWATLPNGPDAVRIDPTSPRWQRMPSAWGEQYAWTVDTLYRTPGNEGEAFVQRSRSMMIVLGVVLGAVVAGWGWWIGGATAAVAATALFALDPNFLAHAALVKNDVAMALCSLLLALATWRMGVRLTPWNVAGAGLACAAALTTKFSGVVLAPLSTALLLALRAVMPLPWRLGGRALVTRPQRAAAAAACVLAIGVVSCAGVWAAYGGRFAAIPDPALRLDRQFNLDEARRNEVRASAGNQVADGGGVPEDVARVLDERAAAWRPDPMLRGLIAMLDRHLFPEAWLMGLIFVHAHAQIRWSYLDGEVSIVGFRRYFPLAMLYKTPLATLIAVAVAAGWALALALRRRDGTAGRAWQQAWLASALLLPAALHLAVATASNLNIGVRHVLPVYPPLFVAVGWTFQAAMARRRRAAVTLAGLLVAGLALETFANAPDHLAFFNVAAGGTRSRIYRLGDSNLDWGQDLPLLAAWQRRHPDVPLYLAYFGLVPPDAYGIAYRNLPGGYRFGPPPVMPGDGDGVVAISATALQCVYVDEALKPFYRRFGGSVPSEVLGGTLFLYDLRRPLREEVPSPCGRVAGH